MPIANTTNKEDIEDAGYHTTNPTIRGTVSFVDSANGIRLLMCHYDVIEPIMIPRSKMTIPMRKSFSSLSLSSSTFYSLVVIIICILSIDIIIFSSEVVAFLPTTTTLMSSSSSSSSSNTSRMMKSTARSDLTSFCKNNLLTTSLLASSSSLSSSSYEHMPSLEHRLRDVLEQNPNSDITGTAATTDNQQQQQQQLPQLLPIFDVLQSVRESLNIKPNLLLQASPGAGKTTIVPLQLLLDLILAKKEEEGETNDSKDYGDKNNNSHNNNNNKQILVVAPRRVAVRSAAQRMSTLLGEKDMVGNTVGYVMRDDVKISKKGHTRIKVVTDGVLLNMLRDDPLLRNIDTVILDEFHERGVGSDTCLALLREVQQNFRSSNDNDNDILKIVVMSATLLGNGIIEAEEEKDSNNSKDDDDNNNSNDSSAKPLSTGSKLMTTLGGKSVCGIIESEGRQYPIQIQWANQVVKMMSSGGGGGGGGSAVNRIPLLTTLLRDRKLLIETISNVVDKAALKNAPSFGDILVFLPGVAECKGVVRELTSRSSVTNVADVFALYGAMSKEEQDRVLFYPEQQKQGSDQRRRQRVIVSTPIAEASLTIPKVTCVVDSGLRREPRCDTDTGMPRLVSAKISQASSIQRSGRAGRVQEGSCLRLYTESDFDNEFIEQTPPEIASTDLAPILLLLADWGTSTLSEIMHDMPFVDPPDRKSLELAERFLLEIGALDRKDNDRFILTDLGRRISKMPCHPRLAAAISQAIKNYNNRNTKNDEHQNDQRDATYLAGSIAAAYCLDNESSSQAMGGNRNNDDPNLVYTIESVLRDSFKYSALLRFAGRVAGVEGQNAVQELRNDNDFMRRTFFNLGKALLPGFIDLVAERKGDASYESSNYFLALGKSCRLDGMRQSPPYILAVQTSTGPDSISRIRSYVSLSKELLDDVAIEKELVYTVPSKGYEVRAKQVRSVGQLELSSSPLPSPSPEQKSKALFEAMTSLGGITLALSKFLSSNEKSQVEELTARIRLDKELTGENDDWHPCFDERIVGGDEESCTSSSSERILIDLIEPWIGSMKSLKELRTLDILRSTLSPERQRYLDENYPTSVNAPDGTKVPIRYIRNTGVSSGNSQTTTTTSCRPMATAKLQQFFGAHETFRVGPPNASRVPVTLSLISPAGKPLAETSDLPFFWKEVYPSIRSEMRGRYPKHPWPEDPLVAVATRKTKKQLSKDSDSDSTTTNNNVETKKPGGKNNRRSRKKK